MKKRIGNDISFVWHIYRKSGDSQVPESFTGKDVEVKLISPLQRPVTIEDVTIATGVVTFTFRGKHQVTPGNYVAILQENKGKNGMVTLDVVEAVTLVPHSYMEEDGDEGDVIEATSVELDSEIGQGIDSYTKAETDALLEGKQDTISDLPAIRSGAQAGATAVQPSALAPVATSGSYNSLSDKPDLSAFITNSVDNLVNYYLKSETYTKNEVQQLIGAIQQFHYEVYPTLPQTGASNVLYLIGPIGTGTDKYEEYVYANNSWTKIGDTSIDLSGYVTTEALTTALADYVTSSALSTTLSNYYNKNDVDRLLAGKADSADLAEVATSGSYNDLSDKPTIPDITGKADKVSNATNGNFAALDSNGNLIDSGHKHSDYLTEHQSLTNYVQKSQTTGLLKNDGTVDTTQYLTQHQDISGKADKSEMSVVPGTGANADKTTITLKQGTSATVLTAHQDISVKENVMPITTATGATLSAVVGNYYRLDNVGTLAITLPTIVGATKLQAITFLLVCGSSALVSFVPQGTETILYQEDFALEDDTTYEVTALWNGSEWTLSRVIYE